MKILTDIIVKYRWEIVGALDLAFIVAYLASLNNRLNRLAIASAIFRNTILTELKGLYRIPSDWPKDSLELDHRLRKAFPNLEIAITNFRPFVTWYRRWAFDKAWFIYRLGRDDEKTDQQWYSQYMTSEGAIFEGKEIRPKNTETCKEMFKKNVDNILKYAKQI